MTKTYILRCYFYDFDILVKPFKKRYITKDGGNEMKKILYSLAALAFAVAVLASARTAYADVLFEHEFREELGGVA